MNLSFSPAHHFRFPLFFFTIQGFQHKLFSHNKRVSLITSVLIQPSCLTKQNLLFSVCFVNHKGLIAFYREKIQGLPCLKKPSFLPGAKRQKSGSQFHWFRPTSSQRSGPVLRVAKMVGFIGWEATIFFFSGERWACYIIPPKMEGNPYTCGGGGLYNTFLLTRCLGGVVPKWWKHGTYCLLTKSLPVFGPAFFL